MASRFPYKKYGQSGLEISDLFQATAQYADDLAVIRSCYHDSFIHGPALNWLYTGSSLVGHPSMGAWVLYGLGSESNDLPAFMVMTDGSLSGRSRNAFGSGYLPAIYQGTLIRTGGSPIMDLSPPSQIDPDEQRVILDRVTQWNSRYYEERRDDFGWQRELPTMSWPSACRWRLPNSWTFRRNRQKSASSMGWTRSRARNSAGCA
ncbi:MAG: DUF1501 domain-containing protein [Terriglobia bacterium]